MGETTNVDIWFTSLDTIGPVPCMPEGRAQPPMPAPEALFDECSCSVEWTLNR
jgi:hypothetical protein